jgi:flagellar biosynthesis anti-sigma factor FlgM
MRIDGFQNIPAVLQSLKTNKAPQTSTEKDNGPASSVSLSSFAGVLQSLQRESAQSAIVRSAKVEQLTQQAQAGKLAVNLDKLAAQMVNSNVINLKG